MRRRGTCNCSKCTLCLFICYLIEPLSALTLSKFFHLSNYGKQPGSVGVSDLLSSVNRESNKASVRGRCWCLTYMTWWDYLCHVTADMNCQRSLPHFCSGSKEKASSVSLCVSSQLFILVYLGSCVFGPLFHCVWHPCPQYIHVSE